MFERIAAVLFYLLFIVAVSGVAARVVGIKEGVILSLAALAWFVFGRLLVNIYSCAVLRSITDSTRPALALGSLIVDGLGILAILRIDRDLIWSTLAAIAISEAFTWTLESAE
jgi:hypothetical protein